MSDGPHKSLPMRRQWKDLAERAAKAVFSEDLVCEAVPYALKKDFREAPLEAVQGILGGGKQGSLFSDERIDQLEAARHGCRGSAAGNTLIDCAIEAVTNGKIGDTACESALANALETHARSSFRSVEEHYQREASSHSAEFVRDRLDAARKQFDFGGLASDLISPASPKKSGGLPKHTGLDEGPPL